MTEEDPFTVSLNRIHDSISVIEEDIKGINNVLVKFMGILFEEPQGCSEQECSRMMQEIGAISRNVYLIRDSVEALSEELDEIRADLSEELSFISNAIEQQRGK